MKWKRWSAGLLCAALLCTLLVFPAAAAELYFTSINDDLLSLTADTMPVWSGGVLYVPYTVFDGDDNGGFKLGIDSSYSRSDNTVTIFTTQQILEFDLNNGTCYDVLTGEHYRAQAITRNGRAYVPVHVVCNLFGLSYSYNSISSVSQGYLVRIKSAAVVLDDATFIDAASNLINRRLREYRQSLLPTVEPTTPTTPTGPTAPTDPVTPSDPGSAQSAEVSVYLAFRCQDTAGVEDILTALERQDESAVFFFSPETVTQNDDLIRRILGSGHSVGLLAQGAAAADSLGALEEGNGRLERVARLRTSVVLAPQEQRSELEGRGYICWNETISRVPDGSVTPYAYSAQVLRLLGSRTKPAYLTLDASENSARVLSTLLTRLADNSFAVSIPLETRL